MKILKIITDIFGFFFGANGFWKILLFPEKNESIKLKHCQFMYIFRPLCAAFWFIILYFLITRLPEAFIPRFYNYITKFIKKLNDTMSYTFEPMAFLFPYDKFFPLYAISFYILCYRFFKWKNDELLCKIGELLFQNFSHLRKLIKEIYIDIPGTTKMKLSPKWKCIKEHLGNIIFINFFLFYILNYINHFATTLIWKFKPENIVPFIGFFTLMEVYHYLSLPDCSFVQDLTDTTLDLIKLRTDYQKYAIDHNIFMTDEYKGNHKNLIENISIAENHDIELKKPSMEFLYQYLEEQGQLEHFDMIVRLIKGENIFCASPFYKDIDACIFFLIFQSLLRQEKALILVKDNGNLEELVQWAEDNLELISGLKKLWNVAILQESIIDVDVGILTFQNVCSDLKIDGLEEYLKQVSFAVILEASDMLAGGQESIITLAEYISYERPKCTWLLCDWNAESMLDLFSHLLGVDFIYVNATPVGAREMVVSYWNLETEPQKIWNPVERFLGIEAGIVEVAGKNKVPSILWYGEEWMPVIDISWILGQYYQLYGDKVAQPMNQSHMDKQIQCYISGIFCDFKPESFLIIEDSCCNLYEMSYQYITRAKEKIYIHILSPNYILRDFMKSKPETMQYDRKYISRFVPEYINSKRNVYLHLLRKLIRKSVSRKELYDSLKTCEEPIEFISSSYKSFDAKSAIKEIVYVIVNITIKPEHDIQVMPYRVFSEEEERMIQDFSYQIINKNVHNAFHKYFQQASYIDETGKRCHINHLILVGHLVLKYLPGEYITLNGRYYQVEKILCSNEETFFTVKRASEQIACRYYYRQLREYLLETKSKQNQNSQIFIFEKHGICLKRLVMDFKAKIIGYGIIQGSWNNFSNMQEKKFDDSITEYTRNYFKKQLLCINLPEKITRSELFYLAAIIHEMFYTLYPQYCYLLSVAVYWEVGENIEKNKYRGVLSELKLATFGPPEEDVYHCFYIMEDSYEDIGLLRSIERNFQRILQLIAEYMEWAIDQPPYF